jgi:hypothetical protein
MAIFIIVGTLNKNKVAVVGNPSLQPAIKSAGKAIAFNQHEVDYLRLC